MWLKYGVSADNALLGVEDVPSGKTNLTCLYCGGQLTAKKGKIKEHHFAHTNESCKPVASKQVPTLPLYDNFNIELSGKELEELKVFWYNYGQGNYDIFVKPSLRLILSKLLVWNKQGYEFTNLGKIPVGALSLALFNEVQEPLISKKLSQLEQAAERARLINSKHLPERIADLRIYRAQYKRILENKLYFLEIKAGKKLLHKIGITKRSIAERVLEVQRDLMHHYKSVEVEVLDTWSHRGNVELYFKHRYQKFNYKIGTLTEYFKFNDVELVLNDLRQMSKKVLTPVELQLMQDSYTVTTCDSEALLQADRTA
jgi:hypothetical protein